MPRFQPGDEWRLDFLLQLLYNLTNLEQIPNANNNAQNKLMPPNKGKLEKMIRMMETYGQACSWFLEQVEALNTTSRAHLNRETYRQACELFDLNRGTLQCTMLRADNQCRGGALTLYWPPRVINLYSLRPIPRLTA